MAKIATREAYGKALAELVSENENIVVLDADLSGSTKSGMAKKVASDRHCNMGIAEGNMMAVAAGLASCGNTVFASSFAMFAVGRAYEQIRNSIGYPQLNVKICASHAGISVGEDGASHQTFEDIGHDYDQLEDAYAAARECKDKPTLILAHTVKGKGVSFMENKANWHGVAPKPEEAEAAIQELEAQING